MKVKFTIPGKAMAKQRPRVTKAGITYTPKETIHYENLVKLMYRNMHKDIFFSGPVEIVIDIFCQVPKSASAKKRVQMLSGEIRPTKKPDIDNVCKTITDALNGIAYRDDAQIVQLVAYKWYGNKPFAQVEIGDIDPEGSLI